jgi:hypothetical protein
VPLRLRVEVRELVRPIVAISFTHKSDFAAAGGQRLKGEQHWLSVSYLNWLLVGDTCGMLFSRSIRGSSSE